MKISFCAFNLFLPFLFLAKLATKALIAYLNDTRV